MTHRADEEESEPLGLTETPADEHESELPDESAGEPTAQERAAQQENAGSALDQPSDNTGGE